MRVVCPNCSTAFEVDGELIPETGRRVRCFNCGHAWHQDPVAEPPASEAPPAMAAALTDEIPPDTEPTPAAGPEESAGGGDDTLEPDTPGPEDQASIDAMFDRDDGLPLEGEPGDGGGADVGEAYQDATGLDMDAEPTGDGIADTFGPVETEVPDHSEDMEPAPAPDLGEEPEPIPDMFASPPPDYEQGGGRVRKILQWTGLGVAALLFLALIVGWYWRASIVTAYPGAAAMYGAVGIEVDTVGLGLTFSDVTPERVARDGEEVLIVRGIVNNTTERKRDVPNIRLVLYDQANEPVRGSVVEPPVEVLKAGGTVGFRGELTDIPDTARRYEVNFVKREKAPGGG